jgi:hypothetical protein
MNRPEQQIHKGIVQLIRAKHPRLLFFHVPNGGARSATEGAIFKSLGVLAGVPDLVFIIPGGKVAFMEVKAAKGAITDSQHAFAEAAVAAGAAWAVVRSIDEADRILSRWLV